MLKKFAGIVALSGLLILSASVLSSASAEECVKSGQESSMQCIPCKRGECAGVYLKQADELNLSEEQVGKLKDIHNNCKKIKIQKKAEIAVLELDIDSLLDEANPDQAKLDSAVDKIGKIKTDLMKECLKASVQARKVLTPEQYKQSQKLNKAKTCPMGEKGEKHGSTPHCEKKAM